MQGGNCVTQSVQKSPDFVKFLYIVLDSYMFAEKQESADH